MIRLMNGRKFFLIWTLAFGALGIAVPLFLIFRYLAFHVSFGKTEFLLWPSSLMFMGLDTPASAPPSRSTVIIIYAVAFLENALLYAAVGAITWPLAYVVRKSRTHRH